jgi:hypothetical protein
MTSLTTRKTRLSFETGDTIRDRGKLREVVIECENTFAYVRLKGTRSRFQIEWSAVYHAAAKLAAMQVRREKIDAKKFHTAAKRSVMRFRREKIAARKCTAKPKKAGKK